MRRFIFHVISALSLVMLLAAIVLTIRGSRSAVRAEWSETDQVNGVQRDVGFQSRWGTIAFSRGVSRWQVLPNFHRDFVVSSSNGPIRPSYWLWPALRMQSFGTAGRYTTQDDYWYVSVPGWMLMTSTSIFPAIWWYRWRKGKRRFGTCAQCGYDLRATPDRCPECGRVAVHGTNAA